MSAITSTNTINEVIETAEEYLSSALNDANLLKHTKIAVYGQSLILDYLLSLNIFNFDNISCIIDDNKLYQGTKYKNKLDIVSLENFKNNHDTAQVFLAMNDCYHDKTIKNLNTYTLYGIRK
jgi:hypothetical protein